MIDILRDIGVIARSLDSIANIEFKDLNLTRGQYLYLVRIKENAGIIPDNLSEMIKVDRTTASRAIQKLERNGLIEKRADSVNKKIKRLFTTLKGDELAEYIVKENLYSNKIALQGLSDEEVKIFSRILNKIKQNTETDWDFVKKGNKRDY
ncbi:MarR family transcriptional regulator [Carnobacterium viridans]|uniref:DNA-binding transcriptional regulator, MarR family n=1 Tax=Carnobacterium viridans TaxID=174587 RepID=A0A1H0ZL14_9LACT|nr:MarR family transcriptional regulator [Carnobacterium viridans]UDE94571.1 MarR family transcriptional regulator [Carnobacterium viridans]SDQ28133.1 DNA-binding transcriptional regulator, MarR family [Carnobacterium viridans]